MLRIILVILLCTAGNVRNAICQHFVASDDYGKAYALLLDLRFSEAEKIISEIKTNDPQNLASVYLQDLADFLFIVVTEDEKEFEKRKELRSQRLNAIEQLPASSPYRLLAEGEIHLHWAFSSMRFGEYLNGAREINKAFHSLEKNLERFPEFLPTYKSMGLLHTLIGTVPDNYRWATKLMGVDGTIEQGVGEMESVIARSKGISELRNVRKETLFLLSFLHINLLNDPIALGRISKEVNTESGPLMDFAKASLFKESGKTNEAIAILQESNGSKQSFPYLNFLLGELKLARMDKDANSPFQTYIQTFRGKSYLKAAYQKLAWHALIIENNQDSYISILSRSENVGNSMLDEDKSAQKELESGIIPNKTLLKARLQFDGGFYTEALKTLINSPKGNIGSKEENLEFTYRLGRIHDELGNNDEAISYYKLTIENGADSKRYFAANSSLMLGLIYEQLGQRQNAINAYEACSEFNNSEYRNSINQKAKAGILRLDD